MTFDFDILFTVLFRHTYFSNAKLECLMVTPDKNSLRTMSNNGLLFKPLKDGFRILYETSFAGRKRDRDELLDGSLALRFILSLRDPDFYNYTSVAADDITNVIFHFKNATGDGGTLHRDEFVSEKDFMTLKEAGEPFFTKPFALLDLELSPTLAQENMIRFAKKTSYWKYIVVGDHLKNMPSPAILDTNSQAVFSGPEKIKLPDQREALMFTSQAPISLTEKADDLFQLVENYESGSGKHKVVKRSLPVPDVRSVSSGSGKSDADKKKNYSEIFIY